MTSIENFYGKSCPNCLTKNDFRETMLTYWKEEVTLVVDEFSYDFFNKTCCGGPDVSH